MATDKRISELPAASALTGTESVEVVQGGANKKTTTQDIADLGGGGTAIPYGITTGTTTLTATMTPAVTAYTDGDLYTIRMGATTTGSSTLNLNAVGAKKIYDTPERQISNNDLIQNRNYLVQYSSVVDSGTGGFIVVGDISHERLSYRDTFDASGGAFPSTGGSGYLGAIIVGDVWRVSVAGTLGGVPVVDRDLLIAMGSANNLTDWLIVYGHAAIDSKLALKQTLINSAVAITDAASMDLTAIKHTLTTSSATRTFTISYTGDDITLEITLNTTASTLTFPATSLCVSEGSASGNNTCALAGVSGDKYMIAIKKIGSAYYVVAKNFGQ